MQKHYEKLYDETSLIGISFVSLKTFKKSYILTCFKACRIIVQI